MFLRVLSLSFWLDVDGDGGRWVALGVLLKCFGVLRVLRVLRVVDGSKKMYGKPIMVSQYGFCSMSISILSRTREEDTKLGRCTTWVSSYMCLYCQSVSRPASLSRFVCLGDSKQSLGGLLSRFST